MATAPNTPASYYLDTNAQTSKCNNDKKEMEKKCAPDNEHQHRGKGKPAARARHNDSGKDSSWVLDHCGPLLVQPGRDNFQEWWGEFKDISTTLASVRESLEGTVIAKLEQEIMEFAGKQIAKFAVRRGLTGWIPIVGWVITAVDAAMTARDAAGKVAEMRKTVDDLKGAVGRMKEAGDKIAGTLDKYKDELKDFGKLSKDDQTRVANNVMSDIQAAYAAANPCLRARKCMLVPFSKGSAAKWAGKGCCPGQTGHHLLPDAMFRDSGPRADAAKQAWAADPKNRKDGKLKTMSRDKVPTRECWSGYKERESPTICVEGNNQHLGSHGALHTLTQQKLQARGLLGKKEMKYTTARDLLLGDLSRMYGCSKECLQEQLDNYYCNKAADGAPCPDCKNAKVTPHDGTGHQPEADDASDAVGVEV